MIICLLTVTILHKSYEILIMYMFHESTFQTLLQLSRFSIWKINPSIKESSLEFWCNVTLNNCMSLKKQTTVLALVTATEVLVLVWNETPQLICQNSVVPDQQFKIVIAEITIFLHFHQVACSKLAGHVQPSLKKAGLGYSRLPPIRQK